VVEALFFAAGLAISNEIMKIGSSVLYLRNKDCTSVLYCTCEKDLGFYIMGPGVFLNTPMTR